MLYRYAIITKKYPISALNEFMTEKLNFEWSSYGPAKNDTDAVVLYRNMTMGFVGEDELGSDHIIIDYFEDRKKLLYTLKKEYGKALKISGDVRMHLDDSQTELLRSAMLFYRNRGETETDEFISKVLVDASYAYEDSNKLNRLISDYKRDKFQEERRKKKDARLDELNKENKQRRARKEQEDLLKQLKSQSPMTFNEDFEEQMKRLEEHFHDRLKDARRKVKENERKSELLNKEAGKLFDRTYHVPGVGDVPAVGSKKDYTVTGDNSTYAVTDDNDTEALPMFDAKDGEEDLDNKNIMDKVKKYLGIFYTMVVSIL